jgi:uncharacterized protein
LHGAYHARVPERRIRILAGQVTATARLNDSRTAEAIWQALPIDGRASRWGDEIYFEIPVELEPEDGREVVEAGELGYWPPGTAFCLFWGRTPASRGEEIRAASPVNVFGRVDGDPTGFGAVRSGERVRVEAP